MKLVKVVLFLNTDQDPGQINEMVHELAEGVQRQYPVEHYTSSWGFERGGEPE